MTLISLSLIYCGPLLFGGQTYLFGPLFAEHYPAKVFYAQGLAQGQLPLWAPNMGLGYPLLSGGTVGALYLPNLILYYLIPVTWAYNFSFFLHFLMGALFMYLLGRSLEFSAPSSLLAAAAFAFSGFMCAQLINLHTFSALIYLPLIFALLNIYFKNPKTLHLVGLAAAWALQFYAGDIAVSLLTAVAAALYVYVPSVWKSIEEKNFDYLRRDLIWGICTALLALILAMAQILPAYELSNFAYLRLPAENLSPLSTLWRNDTLYLDIIPLALAFLALGGRKSKVKIFFAGLLFLSGLMFIWALSPYYSRIISLPGFNILTPSHFMAVIIFAVALLAGFALERLLEGETRIIFFWIFALFLTAAMFYLILYNYPPYLPYRYQFFPLFLFLLFLFLVLSFRLEALSRPAFTLFLLFLVILDLFLFGFLYTPLSPLKTAQNLPLKLTAPDEAQARRRVMFPDKAEVVPDAEKLLQRIQGQEVLFDKVLFLDEALPIAAKPDTQTTDSPAENKGNLLNIKYQTQKVELTASMPEKGWLVLRDNYYPGWEAYVDGQKTKLYRANYTMRAVLLEAGEHKVEFIFKPKIFKWGVIMTLLGILVAVKLGWWSVRVQYRKSKKIP